MRRSNTSNDMAKPVNSLHVAMNSMVKPDADFFWETHRIEHECLLLAPFGKCRNVRLKSGNVHQSGRSSNPLTLWVHVMADLHRDMMRLEQPAFFHHQHHGQRRQRAEEEAGRERQQRAVVILADPGADADAEQRGNRAVQR
jgi:hypothetical protein